MKKIIVGCLLIVLGLCMLLFKYLFPQEIDQKIVSTINGSFVPICGVILNPNDKPRKYIHKGIVSSSQNITFMNRQFVGSFYEKVENAPELITSEGNNLDNKKEFVFGYVPVWELIEKRYSNGTSHYLVKCPYVWMQTIDTGFPGKANRKVVDKKKYQLKWQRERRGGPEHNK